VSVGRPVNSGWAHGSAAEATSSPVAAARREPPAQQMVAVPLRPRQGEAQVSSDFYRGQLERKRKQRIDAERKAGDLRGRESAERAKAAKARTAASRATSTTTAASKTREAERAEAAAATAGRDAARKQDEASRFAKEEAALPRRRRPSGGVSRSSAVPISGHLLIAAHSRHACARPRSQWLRLNGTFDHLRRSA
jgi:hypothetical protein